MKISIRKSYLVALHDMLMAAASYTLSMWLRLGDNLDITSPYFIKGLVAFTATCFFVFLYFDIYRRVWSYTSGQDLVAIAKAVTLSIIIFVPVMFFISRLMDFPRSALLINWFVLIIMIGAPRFAYRTIIDGSFSLDKSTAIPEAQKISILLIGANDNTELFLREANSNNKSNYKVVGIIDNDSQKEGRYIRNVKIYGNLSKIDNIFEKLKKKGKHVQKIIIAPDLLEGPEVAKLLDFAESKGLTISRLPHLTDFKQTVVSKKIEMRPIALEDLLGRPQKALDRKGIKELIKNKRVLITGAGGAIGSELVRQVASYKPAHITLLDNSEYYLYMIDKEMDEKLPKQPKRPVIGDVRDKKGLENIFREEKPDLVFHAAALKHVPMSEYNVSETVLTNIIGTKNVADSCLKAKIKQMVMVSTDKAVNPTNVMGATKRVAEKYVQTLGENKKSKTKFVTVRFGNVLGSTGSVIPLFREQISKGGPMTITHPDITRYFMTIREAVELILQASTLGYSTSDNKSQIFVLDMGEPVLIRHLAEQLVRLAGLKPEKDIKIKYIGLRPGEKLFEELFYEEEKPSGTQYDGVMKALASELSATELNKKIKEIELASTEHDNKKSLSILRKTLPESRLS